MTDPIADSDAEFDADADNRFDADREFYEIARALRLHLQWHAHVGVYSVPGGATAQPDDVDWRALARAPAGRSGTSRPANVVHARSSGAGAPDTGKSAPRDHRASADTSAHTAAARDAAPDDVTIDMDRAQVSATIEDALGFSSMSEALANALGEDKPRASRSPSAPTNMPRTPGTDAAPRVTRTPGTDAAPRVTRTPGIDAAPGNTRTPGTDAAPGLAQITRPRLEQVRAELGDCTRCKLAPSRTHLVFGTGHPDADLMFVGEAPGEQEDLRGEPFVGPSGELLDRMIAAMGWSRDTVYIANVLKCRPPGNRNPEPDEIAACRPFLERQIAAVQPLLLVTLGRPAAHVLLQTTDALRDLRGRLHRYRDIPVLATYHPSYLLRKPQAKRDAWDDLKRVIAELERMGVESPFPSRG